MKEEIKVRGSKTKRGQISTKELLLPKKTGKGKKSTCIIVTTERESCYI